MARPAVFIDRDGTIIEEVGYLSDPDEIVLLPGAAGAVRALNEAGFLVIVITNQAGIARGYFDSEVVEAIHERLSEKLEKDGAFIDAFYYCPHHPEYPNKDLGECDCRKPLPGMLLRAARELDIDLSNSYMIGDTAKDIEAGLRAGCKSILVLTGYGREEKSKLTQEPFDIAETLHDAAHRILNEENHKVRLEQTKDLG